LSDSITTDINSNYNTTLNATAQSNGFSDSNDFNNQYSLIGNSNAALI